MTHNPQPLGDVLLRTFKQLIVGHFLLRSQLPSQPLALWLPCTGCPQVAAKGTTESLAARTCPPPRQGPQSVPGGGVGVGGGASADASSSRHRAGALLQSPVAPQENNALFTYTLKFLDVIVGEYVCFLQVLVRVQGLAHQCLPEGGQEVQGEGDICSDGDP